MMLFISDLVIPVIFLIVITYGLLKKVAIFDTFVEGVKDGLETVMVVFPTLVGLMVAVGILRASGALDIIAGLFAPLTSWVGYPTEVIPLTLMRMVSASAARTLMLDLFEIYGPDSFVGRLSSIVMSTTETIFYTMSVYFLSVKITKTRYTLAGALIANFVGIAASLWITVQVFGW